MQRIYKYITEVHHIFSVCNVTAILWLQYTVHVMLFSVCNVTAILWLQYTVHVMLFSVRNVTAILWLQYTVHVMFRTFTLVLSKTCVQCPVWLFSVVP
jgi:hypothetical protein